MTEERGEPQAKIDRPALPEGYGLADDATGLLAWSWVQERLMQSRNYWVGTTRQDGRPHAAPVWGVWLGGALCFGTDARSRKARNLARNPAVVIHLESGDEVVILEGEAEIGLNAELRAHYPAAYEGKYGLRPDPTEPGTVTVAVRPTQVMAWLERDFPHTATRWRF